MNEKVTMVVPAYNAADTIQETIESLAAQTYRDLEVIIVNDGSKDRTEEIARALAEKHGMQYLHQANAGQAMALNNGWNRASGRYLGYLSADDILYPRAIEELVQFLRESGAWVVYPDYDLIDAESKKIREVKAPDYVASDLIERSVCQPGPGALFVREAFEKTGGWNRELRLTPDFDFWVRVSRHGNMARLEKTLAGFRVHESSQSFAAPSVEKSEEPPRVIAAHFAAGGGFRRSVAMAWAHTLSGRLHLRGGRWGSACSHLMRALASDPSILVKPRFWHLLASGAFGRMRYRLQSATSRKS